MSLEKLYCMSEAWRRIIVVVILKLNNTYIILQMDFYTYFIIIYLYCFKLQCLDFVLYHHRLATLSFIFSKLIYDTPIYGITTLIQHLYHRQFINNYV